jgi:membrane-bound lytic murein transglycosylase MltF
MPEVLRRLGLWGCLLGVCSVPAPARAQANADAGPERFEVERPDEAWIGDLDGMIERRRVRVLVPYSRATYWVELGKPQGIVYEAFIAYEKGLNRKLRGRPKHILIHVLFIPTRQNDLIPALLEGRGDIAAARLTITPARLEKVAFSAPLARDVREVVVTGPESPVIATLADLEGKEVSVRASSSYFEHLTELNARLSQEGKPLVVIHPVPEELEDDDLIEMVNAGLLGTTVLDEDTARFWSQVYTEIEIHSDLAVHEGGEIAWMIRKDSPELAASLAAFIKSHGVGTKFGEVLRRKYLRRPRLADARSPREIRKFERMLALFQKYGDRYDVDHLLMVAQGFQESRLDQNARSPVGAIGVMQIMPDTGKELRVGDIHKLEPNIHAGVKYVRRMIDRYFAEEGIDRFNRACFAFAAYNAGPGRVRQLRREAPKRGLDPNVWFNNVEVVAANRIGAETVTYVANILKYYTAYRDMEEAIQRKEKEQGTSGSPAAGPDRQPIPSPTP